MNARAAARIRRGADKELRMKAQTRIRLVLAGFAVLIGGALLLAGIFVDEQSDVASPAPVAGSATDHGPLLRAGVLRRITVKRGQTVRFRARSATGDELHVHGYDLPVSLPAGKTVDYSFKARLDGVFEIELHGSGEQVAELRVDP